MAASCNSTALLRVRRVGCCSFCEAVTRRRLALQALSGRPLAMALTTALAKPRWSAPAIAMATSAFPGPGRAGVESHGRVRPEATARAAGITTLASRGSEHLEQSKALTIGKAAHPASCWAVVLGSSLRLAESLQGVCDHFRRALCKPAD